MIEHSLHGLAVTALGKVRDGLISNTGGAVFLLGYPDGTVEELKLDDKLCSILNSGAAKEIAFKAVRQKVVETGAVCMVFASEAWRGKSTDKAKAMPRDEMVKLFMSKSFDQLEKLGMITREECIAACAQSEHKVLNLSQSIKRTDGHLELGEMFEQETVQENFKGRQKMFGQMSDT